MTQQVAILKQWASILGDKEEQYLPKIYYFDDDNKVFVMEFLESFELLDRHLVDSPSPSTELSIAKQLGEFMALTHLATHSSKVSSERAEFLTTEYENRALRDIQLEYVFTKAYKEVSEQTSKAFKVDDKFLDEISALKARYNGEEGLGNMSLCHGKLICHDCCCHPIAMPKSCLIQVSPHPVKLRLIASFIVNFQEICIQDQ